MQRVSIQPDESYPHDRAITGYLKTITAAKPRSVVSQMKIERGPEETRVVR